MQKFGNIKVKPKRENLLDNIEKEAISQLYNYSLDPDFSTGDGYVNDRVNMSNNSWRLLSNNNECFNNCKLPKAKSIGSNRESTRYINNIRR